MTQIKQIYKCNICGNIVEMVHSGQGELVCCGQPMELKQEKKQETREIEEKHVPIIEKQEEAVVVTIGSIVHPMEEKHFIEWIEIETENSLCKKFLNPGDEPVFNLKTSSQTTKVRAYCNIHGLWTN